MRAETGDAGSRPEHEFRAADDPQRRAVVAARAIIGNALEVVAACIGARERADPAAAPRSGVAADAVPAAQPLHLPRSIVESLEQGVRDLEVIAVEPPGLRPPGHAMHERIEAARARPLTPLLWTLALHAPRETLFDDIAGRAAYRLVRTSRPKPACWPGALGPALEAPARRVASLADIAGWPGMNRARAARLLDGVYLRAA